MQQLKKSLALMTLLTSIGSLAFAQDQDAFSLEVMLKFNGMLEFQAAQANQKKQERAKEVMQGTGYTFTGSEEGIFLSTSLMLNGKPLDFGEFNLSSRGELTVRNGAATTDQAIPFYVYLKRNGNNVLITADEAADSPYTKIDIFEVLDHAQPGDYLVIEAINKEEGAVKSILKVLPPGC